MLKIVLVIFLFSGCTCSLIINNTHGAATDLVDQDQAASADVDAQIPAL
jgi:hypothetical protein